MTSERLTDPGAENAIVALAQWIHGIMLGPVATAIAVIAVAWLGALMLSGRIEWRRGVAVVLGCFLIFGAGAWSGMPLEPEAVTGRSLADDKSDVPPPANIVQPDYDPYAGAAPAR